MVNHQADKKRRSAHQTQWAAQFAVASELCKRGYQIAFTMGNHPVIDLMVISPQGKEFVVDVKGLYKRNFWVVRPREACENLFYIFAFVPDNTANQFFILTQSQVNEGIQARIEHLKAWKRATGSIFRASARFSVIDFDFPRRYEDKWDALPK